MAPSSERSFARAAGRRSDLVALPDPFGSRIDPKLAQDLIVCYGSPLYVYDAQAIRSAYRRFTQAFPYVPMDCHYAIVCNKNPYVVRVLHDLGAGIHANTPGDAHAALTIGVPAHRIVYSGTNLTRADLDFLTGHRIRLNLDSLAQLRDLVDHGGAHEAGLRLLIDEETRPNRIGVTVDELEEACAIARPSGMRLVGLHMYAGTNTLRASRFVECLDRLVTATKHLPDLEYVDLGGGYGVSYREEQSPLDLERIGRETVSRLEALSLARGRPIRLMLEPGRILVASAGTLLMTVVSLKTRGGRRYVGVDSTVGNVVVESVYHPHHRIEALAPRGPEIETPTDVCGNTTHSRDFLGRSCRLPELEAGDLLALHDVGAYGYAMSSHFLNRPRPAEVVLDHGTAHLTTRRETLDDLVSTFVPH